MIISLGILSLFQLTIVPGLILTRLLKIKGFWETVIFSIGLSQIFNYLFVLIAVLLKIYSQMTALILFIIEIFVLIILYYKSLKSNLGEIVNSKTLTTFFNEYTAKINTTIEWKKRILIFFYYFVFIIAVFVLIKDAIQYLGQPTQIFSEWDSLISWNNWATQWFTGIIPTHTWHYPQLWPANLSIPYQFIGTADVSYFSKYFSNLIEFFIIFIVFVIGIKKKDVGYFLGVFFTSWLMFVFGSQGTGYADSPVAFWGLMTITCLIFAEENKDENKLILLGGLFASVAGLTKQAGLWLVLVYPILIALRKTSTHKVSKGVIIQSIFITIILVIPWYLYKEIQIHLGLDSSEIQHVTGLVLVKQNLLYVVSTAQNLFLDTIKNSILPKQVTFVIIILLMAFSFKEVFWRKICSLVIIPFWIGWIFFFSYDRRNLSLIIPLIALSAGVGLSHLSHFLEGIIKNFVRLKIVSSVSKCSKCFIRTIFTIFASIRVWYLVLLIPIIFVLPHWIPDSRLIMNSQQKLRTIGDSYVNEQMYYYKKNYGFNGKIVTTYVYLAFLPGLKEYVVYYDTSTPKFVEKFNDPEIGYALLNTDWWSEEVKNFIFKLIDEKKIKVIMEFEPPSHDGYYYFVTTCHGVCN